MDAQSEYYPKIGDAIEAQWLGDDSWYPGVIEGILKDDQYDVKWADAQGLADTQVCVCVCVFCGLYGCLMHHVCVCLCMLRMCPVSPV